MGKSRPRLGNTPLKYTLRKMGLVLVLVYKSIDLGSHPPDCKTYLKHAAGRFLLSQLILDIDSQIKQRREPPNGNERSAGTGPVSWLGLA